MYRAGPSEPPALRVQRCHPLLYWLLAETARLSERILEPFRRCKRRGDARLHASLLSRTIFGRELREGIVKRRMRILLGVLACLVLFGSGFAAGQAKNRFSQPRTVLQVTLIKWRPGVPDAEKQNAIDGVKTMAAQIPGMKTIWLKTDRMQPRDWDAAFAIEFASRDAADDYALSPIHEKWEKGYLQLRENSLSPQLSNP